MQTKSLSREVYLSLIKSALAVKHFSFALDASLHWLGRYPGDLEAGLLYARALVGKNRLERAITVLSGLAQADPEFLEAVQLINAIASNQVISSNIPDIKMDHNTRSPFSKSKARTYATWQYVLESGENPNITGSPKRLQGGVDDWGKYLRHAYLARKAGKFDQSEKMLILAIGSNPPTPIVHLSHLRFLGEIKDIPLSARQNLAKHYREMWPACLSIALLAADWMMKTGDHDEAVSLIHQVMSRDIGGQVACRLWGSEHPYRPLWQSDLKLSLDLPVPANVAAQMGWNQLPQRATSLPPSYAGEEPGYEPLPGFLVEEISQLKRVQRKSLHHVNPHISSKSRERSESADLLKIRKDLEILARQVNRPGITQLDGRYPVYIVLSIRNNLEKKFGAVNTRKIINEMHTLAECVSKRSDLDVDFNWIGGVYLPDDPVSTHKFGVDPIDIFDPWSLKLAITDLDNALARRGEMIGALLIVGGPETVPFHHLPNPVDDPDDYVPSDNPYGTRDENYFILEWPVGRLPDGQGTDPNIILNGLRRIQRFHIQQATRPQFFQLIWRKFRSIFLPSSSNRAKSLGYSAAVWRKASQSVYSSIGDPRNLYTSPPLGGNGKHPEVYDLPPLGSPRLGYFNLHGIIDAAEWYGQSDSIDQDADYTYPIALRPQDIHANGHRASIPEIVFSEACYGAYITGKPIESALSLTFMAAGSAAFLGSTCMSYGSISPPLIAADLLGHAFWKFLREGLVAGEALRQAKIFLAHEMHQRQGYLDGEDQKTLISFILYGDPLAHFQFPDHTAKAVSRLLVNKDAIPTVCDRLSERSNGKQIPASDIELVRQIVEQYLPGMNGAQFICSGERSVCHAEGHICPTSQLKADISSEIQSARKVFTLSKQTTKNAHLHKQYARITLDASGKVVKMAVSR